jgi:hypothetical protein
MRARPLKPGDIYEIETKDGFSYFQYTHKNQLMGPLIWVLEGKFREPKELPEVESLPHRFCTFFPVQGVHKAGLIRWLGTAPIPESRQKFPLFRASTGQNHDWWWFWDGEKEWRVGDITKQQMKLPVREICNFPALVQLIEKNWLPELGKRVWEL